jgi:hypothetical protein
LIFAGVKFCAEFVFRLGFNTAASAAALLRSLLEFVCGDCGGSLLVPCGCTSLGRVDLDLDVVDCIDGLVLGAYLGTLEGMSDCRTRATIVGLGFASLR